MIFNRTAGNLSATLFISILIHACQDDAIQDNRNVKSAVRSAQASEAEADKTGAEGEDQQIESPAGPAKPAAPKPATPAPPVNFTMSWDASADPAIVSYKVFLVPPDRNPRFPGKTDVPIQIKNYPLAALQKNGAKYSVTVNSDEIKTALGSTPANSAVNCFTVVAVNAVGNSAHSPVFCP